MKESNPVVSSKAFDIQRRVVAYKTYSSWISAPHVSYIYEPDVTALLDELNKLNGKRSMQSIILPKITFNTLMLKIIAKGIACAPILNSAISYNAGKGTGTLNTYKHINIAVPWTLKDGRMITPVIPEVEKKSVDELSLYIKKLEERIENTNIDELLYSTAVYYTMDQLKHFDLSCIKKIIASKTGKYKVNALKGDARRRYYSIPEKERLTAKDILTGTTLVSNIGPLYKNQKGYFSLLEIISPDIFVIGLSSIQEKPGVYVDKTGRKQIGIRKILPICLTFDHRAIDLNEIIPFEKTLDNIFNNPKIIHSF